MRTLNQFATSIPYHPHQAHEEILLSGKICIGCDQPTKEAEMSYVGGKWRLNEIMKTQKELFRLPEIGLP